MKIHEYQAKELLAAAGAFVPRGIVASTPHEAVAAFEKQGGKPVVLKAQIHAGGRGKGRFLLGRSAGMGDTLSDFGGVKYLTKREDIAAVAQVMFKYPLVTKQTGADGQKVSKVLVQEAADIAREIYVGMVLDRAIGMPILMACAEGGVEIEEVAARTPEKILKMAVNPDTGLQPFQARRMAFDLGFTDEQIPQAEKIMTALARVFLDKDCSLAEINPLVVTPKPTDGGHWVLTLDAKMTFDDNALFRHPEIEALRDLTEENPAEVRAGKAGLSFIQLAGNIGCLVNGAGLAMSTMDIIKFHGGEPANFLDVGGGANKEQVTEALRILLSDPSVKAVLINIFGGIMKCDIIAGAVIEAFKEVKPKVPFVVRLEGTNVEQGRKMLKESGLNLTPATDLTDAAKKVVAAVR
jgi:succinyl-CoA synthetase beta subunit